MVSTDPAPSLGDAFATALAGSPRRVPLPSGRLEALEIDAPRAFGRWLASRRGALEAIALRGTWLDEADVRALLDLSLPGIDEIAALLEIVRLGRGRRYDEIVIDTAPTGHTLRLLAMPETFAGAARIFDCMQARHREIVHALRGRWTGDAADALIAEMLDAAREVAMLLRDRGACEVTLVTLPEALAVEETLDALATLGAAGIIPAQIVVNRLTPPPPSSCTWCAARRRGERQALADLQARLASSRRSSPDPPRLVPVAAREQEPVGVRALADIAAELRAPRLPRPRASRNPAAASSVQTAALPAGVDERWTLPDARLLLFGGKGGVGKTTCAAAAAVALAASTPHRRVLVVSTDPAHSLGDVLGMRVTDTPAGVPGRARLYARELDARRAFDAVRREYATAIDAAFDRLTRGSAIDAAHDRRVMHGLVDLAPPGLDEMAAAIDLVDALDAGSFDTIVIDTAPTGHALRLLETPAMLQAWTQALMRLLLKYQAVAGLGDLGAALLRLSRGLGRFRARLTDPAYARFIVVTRAAELPLAETRRLLRSLRRLGMAPGATILNAAGAGRCARCRGRAAVEAAAVARLRTDGGGMPIVVAPASIPPPRGAAALGAWRGQWRSTPARRRPRTPRPVRYHRSRA